MYFKTMKLKQYINDTFSFQIFLTMASFFIEFVYLAFFIIVFIRMPEKQNVKLSITKGLQFFLWTTSINGKMLMMVTCCNSMLQKIKKTVFVINNFLTKPVDFQTKEEVYFERTFIKEKPILLRFLFQLTLFSTQLANADPNMNAFGFFNIDNTLLHTVSIKNCLLDSFSHFWRIKLYFFR